MTEHMLQTAFFAEQNGAKPTLIAAAVLHDYGHLIHGLDEDIADHGVDGQHEEIGAEHLAQFFVPAVTEPARLHVAAKRYLCAVDPAYYASLSEASVQSLALQGGPFTPEEALAFERHPFFQDAIELRRYDEMGKEPEMQTPGLEHYRPYLEASLKDSVT
jgi:predicted HD phosphohydrolase